jgi:acyl-CoA synthetase (AMP-forming)/AMP-acid ligase II
VVALAIDADDGEQLVLVCETTRHQSAADLTDLARRIRVRIAQALLLPVDRLLLTRPGRIPRTSSGKVRRAACRAAVLDGSLAAVYDWRAPGPAPGPVYPATPDLALAAGLAPGPVHAPGSEERP